MHLQISWTRTAERLPGDVRSEIERRLERLHRHFPEMRPRIRIGLTRSYDGLAFQSDEGQVKLMLDVRRRRGGGWRLPTYWTMGHELMHLAQFNRRDIPGGERACDVHALARLPPRLIDEPPSYLVVPARARGAWNARHARFAHRLALEALARRRKGLRRYVLWWEQQFGQRCTR
jgi:hypothetical protein